MIRQYIGRLGEGKTLCMIYDAWPFLTDTTGKYKIVTNQPIKVPTKKGVKEYKPTEREALIDSFFNDVNTLYLLDEAHLIFPSYQKESITIDLQARLSYMRKYGNAILYTSQGYNHVHKRLRDITNEVVKVKKTPFAPFWRHTATYFDPEGVNLSELKDNVYSQQYVLFTRFIWRWYIGRTQKAYDTLYTSTTTITGEDFTRQFVQPSEAGVRPGLYATI